MMAADPADVSMLHVAFYLRAGGGISYLNDFEGGAQDSRVDGGAHRVCELLAERLPAGTVRLGEPVVSVDDTGTGVRVSSERATYDADAVVVAVPPRLAQSLDLNARAPAPARHVADRARLRGQGAPGLPRAGLAPRRPLRLVGERRGAAALDRRRLAAPRHRRRADRVRDRRGGPCLRHPHPRRAGRGGHRPGGADLPRTPRPHGGARHRLARRGVVARLLRRAARSRRLDPPRPAPHPPPRPRALGRHRDQHRVLRADGGRDPVRPPRRTRDPHPVRQPGRSTAHDHIDRTPRGPRAVRRRPGPRRRQLPRQGVRRQPEPRGAVRLQPPPRPPRRGRPARATASRTWSGCATATPAGTGPTASAPASRSASSSPRVCRRSCTSWPCRRWARSRRWSTTRWRRTSWSATSRRSAWWAWWPTTRPG